MNGSKFAAIAVVVLLAAAGLYYAFVAPSTPPDNSPVGANGLVTASTGRPAVTPPPLRTVGAATSSNSSTPALRALGGESNAAGSGNGFTSGGLASGGQGVGGTTAPTTVGGAPRTEQPTFNPGSLAAGGTGKGDGAPASTQAPITAPGSTPSPSASPTRVAGGGFNNGFDAPVTPRTAPVGTGGATAPTPSSPTPSTIAGNGGVPTTPPTLGNPTTPRATTGAPSKSTPAAAESTHTVASGETMSSIAKRYFGSENKWTLIAKANPSVDPSSMKVGAKLRIPSQGAITVATGSGTGTTPKTAGTTPGATSAGGSHVIASGETLSSLARKYYGSAKHWRKIYEANKSAIGSDPAALKVGQSLTIPSRTAVVGAENVER